MRVLVAFHRWLGVALSVILTVWFLSGIVMLYHGYPAVTPADRVRHLPSLDPARIRFTPPQAFARAGLKEPWRVVLTSFDGRPIYVGPEAAVYADDGSEQREATDAIVGRAAAAWAGRPVAQAVRESITEVDQWTLAGSLRHLRPLFKYSWPDGQQVYVTGDTGDVVQHTTRASRFWAYLGPIPHWLYVPALRTHDAAWLSFMVWASAIACVATAMGLVIAVWRYSPRKRYRHDGVPSALPYRSWKRWHTVAGLIVGVVATTWMFSGMLSLEPFHLEERLTSLTAPEPDARDDGAREAWARMSPLLLSEPMDANAYAARPFIAALERLADFGPRELEWASVGSEPVYLVTNASGDTRIVPVRGEAAVSFEAERLASRLRDAAAGHAVVDVIHSFDAYYRDRHGALSLPAIRVQMHDSAGSRYYIDPRTASVVTSHSSREWVNRWLYHGLHSLDFPWLYNHRPLWDIVVLTLLFGGAALCGTSLVLSWRLIGRLFVQRGPIPVMSTRTILVLLLTLMPLAARAQDPTSDDMKQLQGGWQVVAAEQRGKSFDAIRGGALVISEREFLLRTAAGNELKGTIRVDAASSPRHLDFVHADGKTVWEAIYTVDEETFRLNYIEAGGRDKRPTLFATSSDSAGTVIVMSRMTQK